MCAAGAHGGVCSLSCPALASLGSSAGGRLLLVVRIWLDLVFWSVLSVSQVELLYSSARTCLRAVLTGIPHLYSSSSTGYCHGLQCFIVIEETSSVTACKFYEAHYLELLRGAGGLWQQRSRKPFLVLPREMQPVLLQLWLCRGHGTGTHCLLLPVAISLWLPGLQFSHAGLVMGSVVNKSR